MEIDPDQVCKKAWRHIVLTTDVEPNLFSTFEDRCLDNMISPEKFSPTQQCLYERSEDKFVLDKKGKKKELPEPHIISCLVTLAAVNKWTEKQIAAVKPPDAPKAVELPAEATPSVVAMPNDVTPVDAPEDVTPVDAPEDVTATAVGLPADATPTSKVPETGVVENNPRLSGWLGMVSGFVGSAPTQVGMSANNQEPLHLYRAPVYYGAAIGVLTPEIALWGTVLGRIQLDAVFEYMKFNPMQDQEYSRAFHVLDLGPKVSLQGIYPTSQDMRVFFGPYIGFLMGGLATDGAIEVAKGKGYDTDGKFSFITSLLYGITVGAEQSPTDSQPAGGFCRFDVGARQFFWGEKPESPKFPATMQLDKVGFSGMVSIGVKFK